MSRHESVFSSGSAATSWGRGTASASRSAMVALKKRNVVELLVPTAEPAFRLSGSPRAINAIVEDGLAAVRSGAFPDGRVWGVPPQAVATRNTVRSTTNFGCIGTKG